MSMILAPKTNVNILSAQVKVANTSQRCLIVGEFGSAGTATANKLYRNVADVGKNSLGNYPSNALKALFGEDGDVTEMFKKFRTLNKVTPIDIIPLATTSGTSTESSFTVAGPATSDGVLIMQIASTSREYSITISDTDTGDDIALAIETEVNADATALCTAQATGDNLVLTPKSDGLHSSSASAFRIISCSAEGVSFDDVTSPDPQVVTRDYTGVFTSVASERYQTVLFPYPETLDGQSGNFDLKGYISSRWNVNDRVLDGVWLTGYSFNNVSTNNALTTTIPGLNEQQLSFFTDTGPSLIAVDGLSAPINACFSVFEYTPIVLAAIAAIRCLRLSEGESVAQFVNASSGPLDSFGGPALASKPYFNTPLSGVPIITGSGFGFSDTELKTLETVGGFTIGLNIEQTETILGSVPTTFKTDAAGNADISFKYLNYVDTASNAREYFTNNLKKRFAQSRLTTGDVIADRDMANAQVIESYCSILYQDLSGPDFVLLEAGEDAINFFKTNFSVSIDEASGTAIVTMIVPIVTQLRRILATMQISFGTEG